MGGRMSHPRFLPGLDDSLRDDDRVEVLRNDYRRGLLSHRLRASPVRLDDAVGRGRVNRRPDVALVESLLAAGDAYDLTPGDGPTGYFGLGLEQAIRTLQRERGLRVDGLLEPEGETLTALRHEVEQGGADPGDTAESVACARLAIELGNLDLAIRDAGRQVAERNHVVIRLAAEVRELRRRHRVQIVGEVLISAGIRAGEAVVRGRGLVQALRAFVSSMVDNSPNLLVAQEEARILANELESAVNDLQVAVEHLRRAQHEFNALRQRKTELGCR
jgi:hypothetical protein